MSFLANTNFFFKKNFLFLIDSNIKEEKIKNFDFIFPQVNLIENFSLFINFSHVVVKSLFVKYGVWFARTAETYIKLFYLLSIFPFLWKASFLIKKNFYLIVYIKFWIVE